MGSALVVYRLIASQIVVTKYSHASKVAASGPAIWDFLAKCLHVPLHVPVILADFRVPAGAKSA